MKSPRCLGSLAAVLVLAAASGGAGAEEGAKPATATLPLEDILRLHAEKDRLQREKEQAIEQAKRPPPLRASLDKAQIEGRLLGEGMDLTAHFEVSVVEDSDWVTVPLIRKDPSISIRALPAVENGILAVQATHLSLVTRKAGRYSFDVPLMAQAAKSDRRRTAEITCQGATLAVLRLEMDPSLFRILSPAGRREQDGLVLYPEGDRFAVTWEEVESIERPAEEQLAKPPPIESTIPKAHASIVSTLEGKPIIRVLYELRFQGSQPISFRIPEGQKIERVYLNGAAIPVEASGGDLQIEVSPARAGDESGRIELLLTQSLGVYYLNGTLTFRLPEVSWPVNELFLSAHLPSVFAYTWTGGSLEPVSATSPVTFTHEVPLPGKHLAFHQYLIMSSAPDVVIRYTVDLTDKYYRATGG